MAFRVDSELWWYFNDAAGELGVGSSFGSMVDQILGGGGRGSDVILLPVESDRAMAAVRRWRTVHAVLASLPVAQFEVLRTFHTQKDRGLLDATYPEVAGVVLLLAGKEPRKAEQLLWLTRAQDATRDAVAAYREAGGQYRDAVADARIERLERMRVAS